MIRAALSNLLQRWRERRAPPASPRLLPAADDWRTAVLDDFRQWLFRLDDDETAILREEGQTEAQTPDLLAFYRDLTAFRQEARLQAKATQSAGRSVDELSALVRDTLAPQVRTAGETVAKLQGAVAEARRSGEKAISAELLSLREGLVRNAAAAHDLRPPRWLWTARQRSALDALRDNQRLMLDKLDDALRRLQVVPLAEVGAAFDPAHMRAVAVSEGTSAAPGTVTRVIHQGYQRNGDLLRVADVQVEREEDGESQCTTSSASI
jgi:molecular chaperone GrpE (heat shock protein)